MELNFFLSCKNSYKLYRKDLLYINYVSFFIWFIFFLFGTFYFEYSSLNNEYNVDLIKDDLLKYNTWYYFKNNIIVYHLIILGVLTFGLFSIGIFVFNAFILGYYFQSFYINHSLFYSLNLLLPHFTEVIGYYFSLAIVYFLLYNFFKKKKYDYIFIFKVYLIGVLLIFIGAFCEAEITILFIK